MICKEIKDTIDLCSFSMICRATMDNADSFLQRRRRAFRVANPNRSGSRPRNGEDLPFPTADGDLGEFICKDNNRARQCSMRSYIWGYLLSICLHRKLSLYTRFVDLDLHFLRPCPVHPTHGYFDSMEQEGKSAIRAAISSLELNKNTEERYMEELESGNDAACIRLIMNLLPNVDTLHISRTDQDDVELVVAPLKPGLLYLPNLKKFICHGSGNNEKIMNFVYPLLFSSPLAQVIISGLRCVNESIPELPVGGTPSKLELLGISHGSFSIGNLKKLLSSATSLKWLSLLKTTFHSEQNDQAVDLAQIDDALKVLSSTLEIVDLTTDPQQQPISTSTEPTSESDRRGRHVFDFSIFSVLRTMSITWNLLTSSGEGGETSENSSILGRRLPRSLTCLRFFDAPKMVNEGHVSTSIRRLREEVEEVREVLPNLTRMTIIGSYFMDEDQDMHREWGPIVEAGKVTGVQVDVHPSYIAFMDSHCAELRKEALS